MRMNIIFHDYNAVSVFKTRCPGSSAPTRWYLLEAFWSYVNDARERSNTGTAPGTLTPLFQSTDVFSCPEDSVYRVKFDYSLTVYYYIFGFCSMKPYNTLSHRKCCSTLVNQMYTTSLVAIFGLLLVGNHTQLATYASGQHLYN